MDPVLIAVYGEMLPSFAQLHAKGDLVDRILEDPAYRGEFLARVRVAQVQEPEYDILHGLHNLRKWSKLPRREDLLAPSV